jgi:hypothetical protein
VGGYSDRPLGTNGFFSLREHEKTFDYWNCLADDVKVDLNVVTNQAGERLAFFWIEGRLGMGAFFHFGFLEAGRPFKMEIGRQVLKAVARAGYKCLASLAPASRPHVVAYGLAMGGQDMGRWPGVCYMAERDEWVDGTLIKFILDNSEKED